MKRRILSLVLALSMLATMFMAVPVGANAEEEKDIVQAELMSIKASGTLVSGCTWTVSDDGILTISGNGPMGNDELQTPWWEYYNDIKSVVIEEGITSVRDSSFYCYMNLENVSLPSTLDIIGANAFAGCINLKNITIPERVTRIQSCAFEGCTNLNSITLPKSVTWIEKNAFDSCKNIKTLNYDGSNEEWENIKIEEGNTNLTDAYVAKKPEETEQPKETEEPKEPEQPKETEKPTPIPNSPIKIGDYMIFGEYNSKPILWRCIEIDENGPLMFADDCVATRPFDAEGDNTSGSHGRGYNNGEYRKKYGSNYWGDSNIRDWLNSSAGVGEVNWSCGNEPVGYDDAGFLADFTSAEKDALKEVTQKQLLEKYEYSQSGNYAWHRYNGNISEVLQNYEQAYSEKTTDKMFLLDVKQIYELYIKGKRGIGNIESGYYERGGSFWLRSPYSGHGSTVRCVDSGGYVGNGIAYNGSQGVRPAFYLNQESEIFKSELMKTGDGSREYPYNGKVNPIRLNGKSIIIQNIVEEFTVMGVDSTTKPLTWSTSDESVITVEKKDDTKAKITGKKAGQATVSVTTATGKTISKQVTVEEIDATAVYQAAQEFKAAEDKYLDAVRTQAEKKMNSDGDDTDNAIQKLAMELQERDKGTNSKYVTVPATLPADGVKAVYEAYATYLDQFRQKAEDYGDIDLEDEEIEIGYEMVKDIAGKFSTTEITYSNYGYTVTISLLNYNGKVDAGSATVKKGRTNYYGVTIVSDAKQTAEALTDFVNSYRDIIYDLQKQALVSVFKELGSATGISISELTKSGAKKAFENFAEALQEHGFGKRFLQVIYAGIEGYEAIKDILSLQPKSGKITAEEFNNMIKKPATIYDRVKNLDFSDTSVKDKVVSQAMSVAQKKQKKFLDELEKFLMAQSGIPVENQVEEEKGFFEKVNSWFTHLFQCPVDFKVYDENNALIGYVDDGEIYYNDDIYIECSGDVKKLYVPKDMKVNIEMIGTNSGTMNYVVEEVIDGETTNRANFYDIPLEKGIKYNQESVSGDLSEDIVVKSESEDISISEFIASNDEASVVKIYTESNDGGKIFGGGEYVKGDNVELSTMVNDDDYTFVAWYEDIDGERAMVSMNNTYRFTALENKTVYAKFAKKLIDDKDWKVDVKEAYNEDYGIMLRKTKSCNDDIIITSFKEDKPNSMTLYYNGYDKDGHKILSNVKKSAIFDGEFRYDASEIDLNKCDKVELMDADGTLMAEFERIGEKEEVSIESDIENNTYIYDNEVSTKINIFNSADEEKTVWCAFAVYDENGALIGVKAENVTLPKNEVTEVTIENISEYNKFEGVKNFKTFVWENSDNMKPVVKSEMGSSVN